jgi:sugar phosphate isomerase/epimerase
MDPSTATRLRERPRRPGDALAGQILSFADAIRSRRFTELGSGVLDLEGVLGCLSDQGYEGWLMVEQDSSWTAPSEAAAIGRRVLASALRRLGREQAA